MVSEELIIQIKAEVEKAVQDLKRVETQTETLGKKSSKVFGNIAKVAAGVGIAFIGMSVKAVQAFEEQERAESKLNAVLEATGHVAGLTADELIKMAGGLQDVGVLSDEAIIEAQAMLLTFKQIGGDIFPRVTEAATDMALMFGGGPGGLQSASIMLGKALNDPVLGLSALRRVGIQLTEEQENMVKGFVEVNDIASAQNIILQEVESQFGGLNREMAQTRTGQIQQLKNSFGDLMESIGETELAAVSFANEFVKGAIDAAESVVDFAKSEKGIAIISDSLGKVAGVFAVLGKTVGPPVEALFKGLDKIFKEVGKGLGKLTDNTDKGAGSMNALAIVSQMVASVLNVTTTVVSGIARNVFNFASIVKESGDIIGAFFDAIFHPLDQGKWDNLNEQISEAGSAIDNFVEGLVTSTEDLVGTIVDEVTNFGEKTKQTATDIEIAYTTTYTNVQQIVDGSLGKIGEETEELHEEIKSDLDEIYEKYIAIGVFGAEAFDKIDNSASKVTLTMDEILDGINTMADNFSTFFSMLDAASSQYWQNEIDRVNNSELTEEEKEDKIKDLKEKAWKWQKAASIGESVINTATAVTKALSGSPPPINFVMASIVGAMGAAQTALIAAQPMPSFAWGGSAETTGPTPIMVGDNPSGIEKITVTNPETGGGEPGIYNAIINGEVFVSFIQSKIDDGSIRLERAS